MPPSSVATSMRSFFGVKATETIPDVTDIELVQSSLGSLLPWLICHRVTSPRPLPSTNSSPLRVIAEEVTAQLSPFSASVQVSARLRWLSGFHFSRDAPSPLHRVISPLLLPAAIRVPS